MKDVTQYQDQHLLYVWFRAYMTGKDEIYWAAEDELNSRGI